MSDTSCVCCRSYIVSYFAEREVRQLVSIVEFKKVVLVQDITDFVEINRNLCILYDSCNLSVYVT